MGVVAVCAHGIGAFMAVGMLVAACDAANLLRSGGDATKRLGLNVPSSSRD